MKEFKNILCIRADNMGDLIMSSPAIRALKDTFHANITLLTSKMGSLITPFIPHIDEVIVANLPWVKSNEPVVPTIYRELVDKLSKGRFDLAVIFTVYSQSPLPAAMLAYEAGIPATLAYCRENPYHLVSEWVVEKEPYGTISHQVSRDLKLVEAIGAVSQSSRLVLNYFPEAKKRVTNKLADKGIQQPYILLHPGVSEKKREYPQEYWIEIARRLKQQYRVVISGSPGEKKLATEIAEAAGVMSMAGELTVAEWLALIDLAQAVISVNTATIHIASAFQIPQVVLYALTNPQHTPWQSPNIVLPFSVREEMRSSNQIVCFVNDMMPRDKAVPLPGKVCRALDDLLSGKHQAGNELLLDSKQWGY